MMPIPSVHCDNEEVACRLAANNKLVLKLISGIIIPTRSAEAESRHFVAVGSQKEARDQGRHCRGSYRGYLG